MLGVTGYVRGKALTPDQLMHVPAQVCPDWLMIDWLMTDWLRNDWLRND